MRDRPPVAVMTEQMRNTTAPNFNTGSAGDAPAKGNIITNQAREFDPDEPGHPFQGCEFVPITRLLQNVLDPATHAVQEVVRWSHSCCGVFCSLIGRWIRCPMTLRLSCTKTRTCCRMRWDFIACQWSGCLSRCSQRCPERNTRGSRAPSAPRCTTVCANCSCR